MAARQIRAWALGALGSFASAIPAIAQDATPEPAEPRAAPRPAAAPYSPPQPGPDPYASGTVVLPIDLVTTLRLTDAQNPSVGLARARVQEATARLDQASVLWLPNLTAGVTYFRHSGVDQNRRGDMFTVKRSNAFVGGGPVARFDLADAIYQPLVARQLAAAASAEARAVANTAQLDAASAYLDLLRVYAALEVNADTLARADQMLSRAEVAAKAGLSKTSGDVNRARAEVNLRREERIELHGRVGAASARLGRVLFLADTVDLRPADPVVVPVTLVPPQPVDDLVAVALGSRPELAANRAAAVAAGQRVRQARNAPLIPAVQLEYLGGAFGGGRDGYIGDTAGRGDFTASAVWGLENLGFGNRAEVRLRQAQLAQVGYRGSEITAQVRAEVLEAAKLAGARYRALANAQETVVQSAELYRKLEETSFGMVDRKQYDALEPFTAIQQLNQARVRYLDEVIEYNRAQFRLYTALGQPPSEALGGATETPVDVPVNPPPFAPVRP